MRWQQDSFPSKKLKNCHKLLTTIKICGKIKKNIMQRCLYGFFMVWEKTE